MQNHEEDFAYLRNYRNMIQGDLAELFDCELHVHSSSAFLVLGEGVQTGEVFSWKEIHFLTLFF